MSAPPGYVIRPTTADGNCMFHAIYYAWHPQEGTVRANETASAEELRRITSDTATVELIQSLSIGEFREAFDTRTSPVIKSLKTLMEGIDAALGAPGTSAEYNNGLLYAKLLVYKQAVQLREYWGGFTELGILNKYARDNDLPRIVVWHTGNQNYWGGLSGQPQPGENVRPISWNGYNHFEMLMTDAEAGPAPAPVPRVNGNNRNNNIFAFNENAAMALAMQMSEQAERNRQFAENLEVARKLALNNGANRGGRRNRRKTQKKRQNKKKKSTRKH